MFIFRLENGDFAWEVLKKWEDGDAVGYLKLSWTILGPSWAILGTTWGYLGPSWDILGYLGPILGSSWAILGLSWAGKYLQMSALPVPML